MSKQSLSLNHAINVSRAAALQWLSPWASSFIGSRVLIASFALLLAAGLPMAGAQAQVKAWYSCPVWDQSVQIMFPAAQFKKLTPEEQRSCSMLDIDYPTSLRRACYLKAQFPNRKWYIYNPSDPSNPGELAC